MMTEPQPRDVVADKRRGVAVLVALRTGLLWKCPIHGAVFDPGQYDYQGANMVATFLVNGSDPMVAEFQDDRSALTALLKTICQGYGRTCPQCSAPAER